MNASTFARLAAAASVAGALLASSAAQAYERWVNIVNGSSSEIYSVHISHVGDNSWRSDLLGAYTIPSGYQMVVEPQLHQGYCMFDVRITYVTGAQEFLWRVNLCEATDIVTSNSGSMVYYI